MSRNKGHDNVGTRIKALRAGLKTSLPKGTKTLKVGDEVLTVAEADQALADLDAIFDAVVAAHAALDKRVDERNAVKPAARGKLADYKVTIVALLGRTNEKLVDFGINPARPRKQGARKVSDSSQEKPTA